MINDSGLVDVCLSDDFITSDKYLKHTEICRACNYSKTDLFWFGGRWRGVGIKSTLAKKRGKATTLIFGHSDHPVTRAKLAASKLKGYKNFYGINLNPILNGSHSLPLGLTNNTDETPMHRLLGETAGILDAIQSSVRPISYSNILYANFTISNNDSERRKIVRILEKTNNPVHSPNFHSGGRLEYLKALRSSNFVICPEGNGIDTHRLWETLYVGGTPVVKSNPTLDRLLQDLPVLAVDDWEELGDRLRMKNHWERIQSQQHEAIYLRSSHWESVISRSHIRH